MSELSRGRRRSGAHPLFDERPVEKVAIVLVTSDRGQAGAFNANVIKATRALPPRRARGRRRTPRSRSSAARATEYFSRRKVPISRASTRRRSAPALASARETANRVIADFVAGKVDRVLRRLQRVQERDQPGRARQAAPAGGARAVEADARGRDPARTSSTSRAKETLLERLVPLYVADRSSTAPLLESIASEYARAA